MQSAAVKTIPTRTLTVPTLQDTALFLLPPRREVPELTKEWDEDDEHLTLIKYYSPTSD